MGHIEKLKVLFILIILSTFIVNLALSLTMTSVSGEQNRSSAGDGWIKRDGELIGIGPGWSGYEKLCGNAPISLKFKLENLTGTFYTNMNINGSNRYSIGFINMGNGSLYIYLSKLLGDKVQEIDNQVRIIYDQTQKYQVEIVSENGHIQVFVDKSEQEFGALLLAFDHNDPDPLPPGKIDFETLENSSVILSEITTNCSPEIEIKRPTLGIGHFKIPNSHTLIDT